MPTEFHGNFVFFNLATRYKALGQEYGNEQSIPEPVLYEAARRAWIVAEWRRPLIQYAAIVYQGIIKQVYEVHSWQPAIRLNGTTGAEFTGTPLGGEEAGNYIGQPADPYMPRGATFVVAYNFGQ